MFAKLISNFPAPTILLTDIAGSIIDSSPDMSSASESFQSIGLPARNIRIFEYELYGLSANYTSGQWMIKTDFSLKTNQIVHNTNGDKSNVVDLAIGLEFLSRNNHSISAGLWLSHELDHDFLESQNDASPLVTVSWSKNYYNDDLSMSVLSNMRESPRSITATMLARYKIDDYWSTSTALTLVDQEQGGAYSLLTSANEISLEIKYQF